MTGLEMLWNKTPAEHRSSAIRELKRTTGMSSLDIYSYLGEKSSGVRPPTADQVAQGERLTKLQEKSEA